ncbi:hypothetical protein TWF102_006953 [Orbilia oligospora]|uniref:Cyclin N-terminal domain-containing protein n=1 Tax=Orbilia oligospora TaxID=2813651 RepID=A0A7C8NM80_ORBOL|nr:hypothetical protein TWF103_005826 [Orbilia oligospora]KAF3111280.1 hypothetical protein TWF102_006953 [Orbilia oligospora]
MSLHYVRFIDLILQPTNTTRNIIWQYFRRLDLVDRKPLEKYSNIELYFCLVLLGLKYDLDRPPTLTGGVKLFNMNAHYGGHNRLDELRIKELEVALLEALDWNLYVPY